MTPHLRFTGQKERKSTSESRLGHQQAFPSPHTPHRETFHALGFLETLGMGPARRRCSTVLSWRTSSLTRVMATPYSPRDTGPFILVIRSPSHPSFTHIYFEAYSISSHTLRHLTFVSRNFSPFQELICRLKWVLALLISTAETAQSTHPTLSNLPRMPKQCKPSETPQKAQATWQKN